MSAFRYLACMCAALLASALPLAAAGEGGAVRIEGVVSDGPDRIEPRTVSIVVNGVPAQVEPNGRYAVTVPAAPLYELRIGGDGVFTAIQTFSGEEVADPGCDCLRMPTIEPVARTPDRIELFFAGDTMAGRRFFDPPAGERVVLRPGSVDADLDAVLAPMKPYIESSNLASVNLETVLADKPPGPVLPNKRISFVSTPALPAALVRAGIDYVTMGNNHVYDFQQPGIAASLAAVGDADLAHSGAGHEASTAREPAYLAVGKLKLAMLGFVGWEGSNGAHQAATSNKGGAALGSLDEVRSSVRGEVYDGRVPIIQYHGGIEYSDRPGPTTLGRLREAVDQGAPLAIGHHPHVIQGVEVYRGSLIAPSIGNFLFDQQFINTQAGYVIKAVLERGRFLRAEFIPIAIVDYRPMPAVGRAREAVLRRLFSLSVERGTHLDMSGGHAVVRRDAMEPHPEDALRCAEGDGEGFRIGGFAPQCAPAGGRLGFELLGRGDFALARAHGVRERAFGAANASIDFASEGAGGEALVLKPLGSPKALALYTQGYLRNVPAGDYTLRARIRLPQAMKAELLVKEFPLPGEKPQPRHSGTLVAETRLVGGGGWQDLALSFRRAAAADGSGGSFRPVLRLTPLTPKGPGTAILVDDLALIAWSEAGAAPDLAARWRASFSDPVRSASR